MEYLPSTGKEERYNFAFPYTKNQRESLIKLIKWSNGNFDEANNSYTLEGFAGTGKTTLIKDLIKYFKRSIAVTATTHKAVRVISTITGKTGHTIQKICGLRPNYNIDSFDINNVQFAVKAKPTIKNYNLIIVDEASQLNKGMVTLINQHSKQYRTKVLFVGKCVAHVKSI